MASLGITGCVCDSEEVNDDPSPTEDAGDELDYSGCLIGDRLNPDLVDGLSGRSWSGTPSTIPLSDAGCWSFTATGSGSTVLGYSVRHRTLDPVAIQFVDREIIRAVQVGPELRLEIDRDQDGRMDVAQVLGDGMSAKSELDVTGPVSRQTYRDVDGGTWFADERRTNGQWETISSGLLLHPAFDVCEARPTAANNCSAAEIEEIRGTVANAIKSGTECLEKYDPSFAAEYLSFWIGTRIRPFNVRCGAERPVLASFHFWTNTITWNIDFCDSGRELVGMAFHETMHGAFHSAHMNDLQLLWTMGQISPEAFSAADPTYGCQSLCFGWPAPATRCSCAACLARGSPVGSQVGDKVEIDDQSERSACATRNADGSLSVCSGLPSCVKRDALGHAYTSEAVGALCRSGPNMPPSWHETVADCVTTCMTTCRSFYRSCDRMCQ